METFFEWLDNKNLWIELYFTLLKMHSDHIYDSNYIAHHNELIKKLRVLGLGEEANELEMVRMSQDEVEFGSKPTDSLEKGSFEKKQNRRVAYNAYLDHIESLVKKVHDHISKMGWEEDLNQEANRKIRPNTTDYDYYDDFHQ